MSDIIRHQNVWSLDGFGDLLKLSGWESCASVGQWNGHVPNKESDFVPRKEL